MFKKIIAVSLITIVLSGQAEALPKFIHGHNICATNVNKVLIWMGLKHTNSSSAASFASLRHTSNPIHGDVMMVRRSGGSGWHVAIYDHNGICMNPSIKQRWTTPKCSDIWKGHYRYFVTTR